MKNFRQILLGTTSAAIMSVTSVAMAQDASDTGEDSVFEEIVVTGIRGSLQRAETIKRNSGSVVDAISAESIGKFPDTNVADSLQRITGVAITRGRGGEGQFVTVRGLGEEFNAVTYNGRLIATENLGREFSFDVLASELVAGAQVYKSSEARNLSGSIGGLVNFQGAKPFDTPGFRATASIAGGYEDISDDVGTQVSAIISNTWGEEFGILASIAYQEREVRNEFAGNFDAFIFDIDQAGNVDDPNDAVPLAPGGAGARIGNYGQHLVIEDRERIGGTITAQWRPSPDFEMTVDALYSDFSSPGIGAGGTFFPFAPEFFVPGSISVNQNGNITAADFTSANAGGFGITADSLALATDASAETFQIGTNIKYDVSDRVKITADLSYSSANGSRSDVTGRGSDTFFVTSVGFSEASFRLNEGDDISTLEQFVPNSINSVDQLLDPRLDPNGTTIVPFSQANPETFRAHFARDTQVEIEDEVFTGRFDVDWDFDDDTRFRAGAYFALRGKTNNTFENNARCEFCGFVNTLRALNPAEFDSFVADGTFNSIDTSGFLSRADGGAPIGFAAINPDLFRALYPNVGRGPDNVVVPVQGFNALDTVFQAARSNDIQENVYALYAQADVKGSLGSLPFKANIGLRVEYTDLTSTGVNDQILSVRPTGGADQVFGVIDNAPVEFTNDYVDFLPSVNIAFDLTEELILRAGFSTTITRPTFTDLSTRSEIAVPNIGIERLETGNPSLEPTRANSVDISLEYYGERLTLNAAAFYKDISDFVSVTNVTVPIVIPSSFDIGDPQELADLGPRTIDFTVTRPENGDEADVYGIEIGGRYDFDNGFGIGGNITLAESNATILGQSAELENVSNVSYNAFVYYEDERLQARVALNHRGEFLQSIIGGVGGAPDFVESFTTLDAQATYSITDNVSVFVQGINLNGDNFRSFSRDREFVRAFIPFGRRVNFGLRADF